MTKFFSRLSYSLGNEDSRTEHKALQIQEKDRVLCITASGDRPLNLLTHPCQEMVSIDCNPSQNHLLALKAAALEQLPFADYRRFLGMENAADRLEKLRQLQLPFPTAEFWKRHTTMIEKGILFQGAVEVFLNKVSSLITRIRKEKVSRLFSFHDLEEQKVFVARHWDKPFFRKILSLILHPKVNRFLLQDPGLQEHLMPNLNIGTYIYDRFLDYAYRALAKESLLLNLVFNRGIADEALPAYLLEEPCHTIRANLSRLQHHTVDLITYLESCPARSFDAYSLTDVASYLPKERFHKLLREMQRTARPGARFCLRQFLSDQTIDPSLGLQRNPSLEKELEQEDRCIVYRFMVGTINPS